MAQGYRSDRKGRIFLNLSKLVPYHFLKKTGSFLNLRTHGFKCIWWVHCNYSHFLHTAHLCHCELVQIGSFDIILVWSKYDFISFQSGMKDAQAHLGNFLPQTWNWPFPQELWFPLVRNRIPDYNPVLGMLIAT